jgi:flavin reductase (DIM6/NTAB) family NADH-FMN oxidoreductase RutF
MTTSLTPSVVLPSQSDLDSFWAAGMRFTTGVSVITLGAGEEIHGATVSSFTMVSRRPALISLCISTSSGLTEQVIGHRSFAINILSRGQEELARRFGDPARGHGPIEFAGVPYVPGFGAGVPLLSGALCWLWCQFRRVVPAGDHQIVLGGVTAVQQGEGQPLLYFGGRLHAGAIEEPAA